MSAKEPKLTPAQWDLLDAICRTNGGGLSVGMSDDVTFKRAQSLYRKGLAQGKYRQPHCAVHTRAGLAFWRARNADQ